MSLLHYPKRSKVEFITLMHFAYFLFTFLFLFCTSPVEPVDARPAADRGLTTRPGIEFAWLLPNLCFPSMVCLCWNDHLFFGTTLHLNVMLYHEPAAGTSVCTQNPAGLCECCLYPRCSVHVRAGVGPRTDTLGKLPDCREHFQFCSVWGKRPMLNARLLCL